MFFVRIESAAQKVTPVIASLAMFRHRERYEGSALEIANHPFGYVVVIAAAVYFEM